MGKFCHTCAKYSDQEWRWWRGHIRLAVSGGDGEWKNIDKVLEKYPAKVFKNRKEHILIKNDGDNEIKANSRTVPGIITNRGCCYAGCKGVVLGPLRDAVVLTHGPIGCGYYTWGTRRNKGRTDNGEQNYLYIVSYRFTGKDIVFGGKRSSGKQLMR